MVSQTVFVPESNFVVFDTSNKLLMCYTDNRQLSRIILEYDHVKETDDNFIIAFCKDEINYSLSVFKLFGVYAKSGLVARKCSQCNIYNTIDGQTWDNYADYCDTRKLLTNKNCIFKAKFWFNCPHPIAPNNEIKVDGTIKTIYISKNYGELLKIIESN